MRTYNNHTRQQSRLLFKCTHSASIFIRNIFFFSYCVQPKCPWKMYDNKIHSIMHFFSYLIKIVHLTNSPARQCSPLKLTRFKTKRQEFSSITIRVCNFSVRVSQPRCESLRLEADRAGVRVSSTSDFRNSTAKVGAADTGFSVFSKRNSNYLRRLTDEIAQWHE